MKIAVVDHVGNHGGGSRVVRALIPALVSARPELKLTYFGNQTSMTREGVAADFLPLGVQVKSLRSYHLPNLGGKAGSKIIRYGQNRLRRYLRGLPYMLSGEVHKELQARLKDFDLAFFPWPYLISPPDLPCPLVGTFHDFNFRYYFGGTPTYDRHSLARLNVEIPEWLNKSIPVVSSHFMAKELTKFYPSAAHKVRVVPLAPMSVVSDIDSSTARRLVRELGVEPPYILYPCNLTSHKNMTALIVATSILRGRGWDGRTVITGPGTDFINGKACEFGLELGSALPDVIGLGYVTNLQMDSLIQSAAAVVSTSLYEAGNGPGIDAWGRGVPVAMSNIPSFVEHLDVLGVNAEVFRPMDPIDIANKIELILSDSSRVARSPISHLEPLTRVTWADTAQGYIRAFDAAMGASEL